MACISEAATGFPLDGRIPFENGDDPEVLVDAAGTADTSASGTSRRLRQSPGSRRRQWPLGRGFERFYGFLGGETNQWYPLLVHDNQSIDQPLSAGAGLSLQQGHHRQSLAVHPRRQGRRPDKPWFLYFCAGLRTRSAPRAQGVGGQVQGQVRHGLREVPGAGARPSESRWASFPGDQAHALESLRG